MQCLTFRDILAEDRAEQLKRETDQVAQELERRLLANVSSPGDFAAVHALPRSSVDIPDDPNELCSAKSRSSLDCTVWTCHGSVAASRRSTRRRHRWVLRQSNVGGCRVTRSRARV